MQGTQAETHGLGSRVEIVVDGNRMLREIDGGGSSHLSQNETIAHFGLGSAEKIDSVIVIWTGGERQILVDQPVNQLITVVEPKRSGSSFLIIGGLFMLAFGLSFLFFQLGKSR